MSQSVTLYVSNHNQRRVTGALTTIGQAWEEERAFLRPLPPFAFDCCAVATVRLTPYSQATFETNRYSVPVHRRCREVTVKAYPFHIELLDHTTLVARHPRSYDREQDVFDPLHYLPLLAQRPGAFDYAKPMRRWREGWPPSYHRALHILREKWPDGRGVQEFIRILHLHQDYSAALVEQAVEQALGYGCVHLDGVLHCLRQLALRQLADSPTPGLPAPDGPTSREGSEEPSCQGLTHVGSQPIDLTRYNLLLKCSH